MLEGESSRMQRNDDERTADMANSAAKHAESGLVPVRVAGARRLRHGEAAQPLRVRPTDSQDDQGEVHVGGEAGRQAPTGTRPVRGRRGQGARLRRSRLRGAPSRQRRRPPGRNPLCCRRGRRHGRRQRIGAPTINFTPSQHGRMVYVEAQRGKMRSIRKTLGSVVTESVNLVRTDNLRLSDRAKNFVVKR